VKETDSPGAAPGDDMVDCWGAICVVATGRGGEAKASCFFAFWSMWTPLCSVFFCTGVNICITLRNQGIDDIKHT
jgi:hypothetical protein